VAAKKKIATMRSAFTSISSAKLTAATTNEKKQAIIAVQMAMASRFAALEMGDREHVI
jgi:hypothetical protein